MAPTSCCCRAKKALDQVFIEDGGDDTRITYGFDQVL